MEQAYKGYFVRSGAAPIGDSVGFKPIAQIKWTENGQERIKLWTVDALKKQVAELEMEVAELKVKLLKPKE